MSRTPNIDDILFIPADERVFQSKSGGSLVVPFKMNQAELADFLSQDESETAGLPDIHGLRTYIVGPIKKGMVGGRHFHRIRKQFASILKGSLQWDCEDLSGEKRSYIIPKNGGLYIPPYIHDVYTALEEGTTIMVVCNTLFDPDDPQTQDTFSTEEFRELQST